MATSTRNRPQTPAEAPKPRKPRTVVTLPSEVTSGEAVWPGGNRGIGARNAELRAQVTTDVTGMALGSVRQYFITGEAEQEAFANLFRSVVESVHGKGKFGVQTSKQADSIYLRLSTPQKRAAKTS